MNIKENLYLLKGAHMNGAKVLNNVTEQVK